MNTKQEIFDYIESRYCFTYEQLKTKSKTRKLCNVRQVAMFLLVERLDWGFAEAASVFGLDHSTAHHAHGKVAGLLKDKRIDFEGLDISTIKFKHRVKTVDKSLDEALKIFKDSFQMAFKLDPFGMMMDCNKIIQKRLNRKD